jgi:hypothetical protein
MHLPAEIVAPAVAGAASAAYWIWRINGRGLFIITVAATALAVYGMFF